MDSAPHCPVVPGRHNDPRQWGGFVNAGQPRARIHRALSTSVQRASRHHRAFLDRETGPTLLADNAATLRQMLAGAGLWPERIADYLSVVGSPEAMEAALAWYRATGLRIALPPITVPTCYIWGDDDASVGRAAAEGTAAHVSAAYRFEVLDGVGHFSSDEAPERVSAILVDHMRNATAP